MAVLKAHGIAPATATSVAGTVNAGGTVLGVSFAATGAKARAYQGSLLIYAAPLAKLVALRDAYEASRGPGAAPVDIDASVPSWSSLTDDEKAIALLGRELLP